MAGASSAEHGRGLIYYCRQYYLLIKALSPKGLWMKTKDRVKHEINISARLLFSLITLKINISQLEMGCWMLPYVKFLLSTWTILVGTQNA